ncbi:hypothetical protein HPP92_003955 [Vanilla planifolia]|uniref:Uncharacterized protein n=1 Tax=Vanilla planifolia TaxID=51239 RepID=A0A835RW19_VANPL|nr:hypothetical protein HPP92_003955 [Vanilla planifolia]
MSVRLTDQKQTKSSQSEMQQWWAETPMPVVVMERGCLEVSLREAISKTETPIAVQDQRSIH